MAYRDARFIVNCISSWANEYRQDWVFSTEGSEIGRIHNGRIDAKIQQLLSDLLDIVGGDLDDIALEQRATQILAKYEARNRPE
jgi:hypothetical protein